MVSKYLATRHSNNNYNVHRRELSAFFTYCKDVLEKTFIEDEVKIPYFPGLLGFRETPIMIKALKMLQTESNKIVKCKNMGAYIRVFDEIYNYGLSQKNKLHFNNTQR